MKWDGHTHSPYCPHGSTDHLTAYIEQAISLGFECISITEHAPLPQGFVDPVPAKDSAMAEEHLAAYLSTCRELKQEYQPHISVKIGLELDFVLGFEKETTSFLQAIGPELDDAILSVHFLPTPKGWVCLDYSDEVFEQQLLSQFPSVDEVYLYYYQVMHRAVQADLGPYKPKRIGHLSLIEKFKQKFPSNNKEVWWSTALEVLQAVQQRGYSLDLNTAGLGKEFCKDVYPSLELRAEAQRLGIPFVYGSDAHQAQGVGKHYHTITEWLETSTA